MQEITCPRQLFTQRGHFGEYAYKKSSLPTTKHQKYSPSFERKMSFNYTTDVEFDYLFKILIIGESGVG